MELVTAGAWEFIRIGVFLFALLGASGVIPWTGPLSPASILFAMAGLWVGRKTKEAEVGRWWNHER